MSDIEALETRLAHSKQQLQALIRLVESKPDEMPCEENAARVLASMGIPSPRASQNHRNQARYAPQK